MITSLFLILVLVVMEGLLSVDNALVLAVKVKCLPKEQQKKALFYGLWGAYFFRIVAILLGSWLVKITFIKVLGAAYLMWIVYKHFFMKDENNNETPDWMEKGILGNWINKLGLFWRTVIALELLDITFSADSVIAAFGVSDKWWIIYIGGILGILMMRGVAQIFLKLLERVPELEQTAYVLIGLISIKMLSSTFGYHVNELLFFAVIVSVFGGTFLVSNYNKNKLLKVE